MSADLCATWFSALAALEAHTQKAGIHDPIPIHLVPLLNTTGRTILAEVMGASCNVRHMLQAALSRVREDGAEQDSNLAVRLSSAVQAAETTINNIPESDRVVSSTSVEQTFQRVTRPEEQPLNPSQREVELQPELPISPGGWESTLAGLQKMHVDVGNSLNSASSGEEHARGLLVDMSDVRTKTAVSKAEIVQALAELQLLVQAARLHMEAIKDKTPGESPSESCPSC
jgi:hypothetical protein